jgi:hypothetical protein
MENSVKHLAWSSSLVACVYLATSTNWQPISFQIGASGINPSVAGLAQNNSSPVNSTKFANPANPLAFAPPATPQVALAPAITPSAVAPIAVPAPTPQQVGTVSYATIEDPNVARQVTATLAKLAAVIDVPPGTPESQVATIFFDPRCPYCHNAFTTLHGRFAVRWVPVVVLGDPEGGIRTAAAILSGLDPVAALKTAFDSRVASSAPASPELLAKLAENKEAFASIFAASPALRPGVPTMFVPRPDGRLAIMVGFEPGDDAKLRAVLTGS